MIYSLNLDLYSTFVRAHPIFPSHSKMSTNHLQMLVSFSSAASFISAIPWAIIRRRLYFFRCDQLPVIGKEPNLTLTLRSHTLILFSVLSIYMFLCSSVSSASSMHPVFVLHGCARLHSCLMQQNFLRIATSQYTRDFLGNGGGLLLSSSFISQSVRISKTTSFQGEVGAPFMSHHG